MEQTHMMTHPQRPQLDHMDVLCNAHFAGISAKQLSLNGVSCDSCSKLPMLSAVATGEVSVSLFLTLMHYLHSSALLFGQGYGIEVVAPVLHNDGHGYVPRASPSPIPPLAYDSAGLPSCP